MKATKNNTSNTTLTVVKAETRPAAKQFFIAPFVRTANSPVYNTDCVIRSINSINKVA